MAGMRVEKMVELMVASLVAMSVETVDRLAAYLVPSLGISLAE